MTIAPPDFDYLSTLLKDRAAIVLEPGKEYLAVSRLQPVARSAGLADIAELVTKVKSNPRGPLVDQVVDAMTTNETSFFRDSHPFEALKKHVLPQLFEARKSTKTLKIWCAASSSGQEPYSLAMMMLESFPEMVTWNVQITATDISPSMLERAATGRYSQLEINRGLPAPMLVKYFKRDGAQWQLDDKVRRLIKFAPLNLIGPWTAVTTADLVMIRNVLIYFDQKTKDGIMNRINKLLPSDGYLMVGSSETVQTPGFEKAIYERTTFYKPLR